MSKLYGPQDKSGLKVGKFDTSTPETDDIDRQLGHTPPWMNAALPENQGIWQKTPDLH